MSECKNFTNTQTNIIMETPARASPTLIKLCRVCGDKAIAFNFNGLTCESCKSFFRRNATKINKFVCNKEDNCRIELSTRSICKKCRLQKCIDIGMKKEMVLEKRKKTVDKTFGDVSEENKLLDLILRTICDKDIKQEEIENKEIRTNIIVNIDYLFQEIYLNPYEQSLIKEVNQANTNTFVEELSLDVKGEIGTFKDGLNWVGVYIRKVIKFCKSIPQFKWIDKEDQLLIIKPFFTEQLLVRFTFAYSFEHDAFPILINESSEGTIWMKISRLNDVPQLREFCVIYRKFIIATKKEMENDVTIRNLLSALLMFRPRDKVTCPEFIRYNYFIYLRLLARYLEHKYQDANLASVKYERLLFVINEVCEFRQPISDLYTVLETQEIIDVLTEIYDLKLRFDKLSI